MIRVESEETQDYVCEMLTIGKRQRSLPLCRVLSASRGEPFTSAIYFCDNRCSEKAIKYWQIASVVVEERGEGRAVNLCQQCCKERQVQQGESRLNSWQWRAVVEKKTHRGRIWRIMGNEQLTRGMWEYFTFQRAEGKRIRDEAAREKQEGIQGQWQQESPFREILEKARRHEDMGCSSEIMRTGHFTIRDSRWEEFEE